MAGIGGGANFCGRTCAIEDQRDPRTCVWLAMLTVLCVRRATVAGLWFVSQLPVVTVIPFEPVGLGERRFVGFAGCRHPGRRRHRDVRRVARPQPPTLRVGA